MELKTLKDLVTDPSTIYILKQEAIKWIRKYESTNMVCHQWMANTLRHFLNIDRKGTPYLSQKGEKKFAIIQIKKIMKDFNLTDEDLK